MPQSSNTAFSGIFVSYRRDDSSRYAGRLFDRLVSHFGKDRIFMDIDTIEPGEDFVTVIENAVGSCEILIAIIGKQWLSSTGRNTGRLDNPNDFVRLEIATALSRDVRVIPVLVQRASMPKPQDLPDDLVKFTRRNAVELTDLRWQSDVDQLISVMERVLVKRDGERQRAREQEERRLEEENDLRLMAAKAALHEAEEQLAEAKKKEQERIWAETKARSEEEVEGRRVEAEREAEHGRREVEKQTRVEEERDAPEARLRESNVAASQEQLEPITAAVVSRYKNSRVLLIAGASLILLVVAAVVIWRTPRDRNSSGNTKPAADTQTTSVTQPATAKPSQVPSPAKPSQTPGAVVQNQMGIELVYVPAGSFLMGAKALNEFETPAHQVTIKDGFYMGKYEVTQSQWKKVMGTNPSEFKGDSLPVERILFSEVKEFVTS